MSLHKAVIGVALSILVAVLRRIIPEIYPLLFRYSEDHDIFSSELNPIAHEFFHRPLISLDAYDEALRRYRFGRSLEPRHQANIPQDLNFFETFFQLKQFCWVSAAAGDWMIGVAVLEFHYITSVVISTFNVVTGRSWKSKLEVPLAWLVGLGAQWESSRESGRIGPIVDGHRVVFNNPMFTTRAEMNFTGKTVKVYAATDQLGESGDATKALIHFEVLFEVEVPAKHFGMVFPIGPRRASIVHKFSGARLSTPTYLRLGATEITIPSSGSGSMDYTRGLLRRMTKWRWASLTHPSLRYGFHFSTGTYDVDHISVENTVFVNGTVVLYAHDIAIEPEPDSDGSAPPYQKKWSVRSLHSEHLRLIFTPADYHHGSFHYGVLDGDLFHMWGRYSGIAPLADGRQLSLDAVGGVLEEHYALW